MKTLSPFAAALALTVALLAGCTTRSISNSSYDAQYERQGGYYRNGATGSTYRGELSELDVVGVAADGAIAETDIRTALAESSTTRLVPASRILLIQSGAEFPDDAMLTGLGYRYQVQPFSGIPSAKPVDAASYSKSLRLAAARGGYDKIVCYWGTLESERVNNVTKLVSWVPIAGYILPDEKQSMRIRLRAVVVDVASGRWTYVSPASTSSNSLSSVISRRNTDQALVSELKEAGYKNLVQALAETRNG